MSDLPIINVRGDIESFVSDRPGSSTREKGEYFLEWICQRRLPETNEDDLVELDGCGDQGIDAAAFAYGRMYIVQAKYGSAHRSDAVKAFNTVSMSVRSYLDGSSTELPLKLIDFLEDVRYRHQIELKDIPLVALYVTSAEFTESERVQYRALCRDNPHLLIEDLVEIAAFIRESQEHKPSVGGDLHLASVPIVVNDGSAYLCVANLGSLASFARTAGPKLFEANVRSYLSRTSVNKGIASTLLEDPSKFFYYNNGVTIVCESISVQDQVLTLDGAQVVNGCQTVSEILKAAAISAKQKKELSGSILVKVIAAKDDGLRQKISQSTNSQNAVRTRDFLSMANEQKKLQRAFKRIGYYYEISRGQSALLSAAHKRDYTGLSQFRYLEKPGARFRRIIAFDSQQCFLAAYVDKPGAAKNTLGQHHPLDAEYDELFEGCQSDDPIHHLLPMLVYEASAEYDYGLGNQGWKGHARLFYVCVVFRVIAEALRILELTELPEHNQIRHPRIVGTAASHLFTVEEVGMALLSIADEVCVDFNDQIKTREDYNERNSYRRDAQRRDREIGDILTARIHRWLKRRSERELLRRMDDILRPYFS